MLKNNSFFFLNSVILYKQLLTFHKFPASFSEFHQNGLTFNLCSAGSSIMIVDKWEKNQQTQPSLPMSTFLPRWSSGYYGFSGNTVLLCLPQTAVENKLTYFRDRLPTIWKSLTMLMNFSFNNKKPTCTVGFYFIYA